MKRAIAYYRVSTERQGRSGLGLDAQRKSVEDFARNNRLKLIEDFIETESGSRNGRLGLLAALKECQRRNATLLIAKLDRLSRNV
ncbi:MAG: recombinase family protein, partial [Pedobacter sp.]